ncbi:MAG TPA: amidohydrolase family protein [Methylomirabilota bacterium]|jgi:N-acyl-D-aspartate/D-glutamate deacylase|nr:amidohydrolase family protein [Methylomirabilota bacterium]
MTHDLVIRGGLIVDGTGGPARPGDVAVTNGRIAEVGAVGAGGRQEIDAAGLAVAPGFIDPHTHYDAQLTWDPLASCSSWHGITTIVTGNCGFTIAPCRPDDRGTLMRMLEYVEGMSLEAMEKGIRWEFETFREYLDVLDRAGLWVNVGAFVGHSAIRQYVMGDAAWERAASEAEIAEMRRVVKDAMAVGAVGLSTSANTNHVGGRGRPVPSRVAEEHELTRLVAAMGETGRGILEVTIGGTRPDRVAEIDRFVELYRAGGRPVTPLSLRHNPLRPDEHRTILGRFEALHREGIRLYPQVTCSPLTATFQLSGAFVFYRFPVWRRVMETPPSGWQALFGDPAFRAEFAATVGRSALFTGDASPLRVHRVHRTVHARFVGRTVHEVAAAMGKEVVDAFFDLALDDELGTEFTVAIMNTDAAAVAEIFTHPLALLGLGDAGAHLTLFCEAGQTSRLLGHWVRERRALSLEEAVRRITSMPADVFGLADRGRLAPGLAADIVVFDPDTITEHPPELVHDLPDGGPRLVQRASGIAWSFVNGRALIREGRVPEAPDGPGPGRVLRPGVSYFTAPAVSPET